MEITILGWPLEVVWRASGLHFLLSAFVGSLVYYLTLTILSKLGGYPEKPLLGLSISQFSLSLALLFSILSHMLVDFTGVGF